MLFQWATSVTIVLSLILAAVVASVLLDNIFTFRSNRKKKDDPLEEALLVAKEERKLNTRNLYQQITLVYVNQIFNSILTIIAKLFELPSIAVGSLTTLWQNRQIILLVSITSAIAFIVWDNNPLVLEKLDGFYSCVVTPFVNNVLFSILHVVNLLWATFVPFYNIATLLTKQLFAGAFYILTKCGTSNLTLLGFQKGMTNFFVEILDQTLAFTGLDGTGFAESNMFLNDFKMYPIVARWREVFDFLPETFACFCKATRQFSDLVFFGFLKVDYVDYMVHHFFNMFLSFAQVFFKIIPPYLEYPDFAEVAFHYSMVITEFCELMDAWIFEAMNVVLETMNVDGGGIIVETPKIFVFETVAHVNSFFTQLYYTFSNAILHVVLPFDEIPITNTKYMASLFKLENAFIHLNLFVSGVSHILSWIVRVLIQLILSGLFKTRCSDAVMAPAISNGTACVEFIDGQCAVSCLSSTKIKIHDINNVCLFQSDTKNKYRAQKTEFQRIIEQAADRMKTVPVEDDKIYRFSQFLPVEDKELEVSVYRQGNFIHTKTTLGLHTLRNVNQVDHCLNYFQSRKPECYQKYFEKELQLAYGVKGGSSLYKIIGCSFESFLLIPLNFVEVAYSFGVDYFWFNTLESFRPTATVLSNRNNYLGLLRAYSGPWFSRDSEAPCNVILNTSRASEQGKHFNSFAQYTKFLQKNANKCGRPNMNEHVFYHMDRLGLYLINNLLEKETFGKILFNGYRFVIEQFRIALRIEAEAYTLSTARNIFREGRVVNHGLPESFMRTEIGCLYDYGNATSNDYGFCSTFSTTETKPTCDVYNIDFDKTDCACIENPGIEGMDFQTVAEENTKYYSTKAIRRWCFINFWEFNYVLLARMFNGLRNLLTSFATENIAQGFPATDNVCDSSSYQYSFSTSVQTIFGETCEAVAYKGFFCPTGELLQRIYLALSRYLRKEQRNFLFLIGNEPENMKLSLVSHVCDAQNAIMALDNMVSALFIQNDLALQRPFTKLLFSVTNIITVPVELAALLMRTLRAFIASDPQVLDTGRVFSFKSASIDTIRNILMKSLTKFFDMGFTHFIEICDSFQDFLNTIIPCSGGVCAGTIFDVFKIIATTLQSLLSDVALPTVLDLLELGMRLVSFLVDPSKLSGDSLANLVTRMFGVITSTVKALASNVSVWLNFLFDTFLGPIGDIIKSVESAVCSVIGFANTIGLGLDAEFCGITAPTASVASTVSSTAETVVSDVGNFFSSIFGRRRLLQMQNYSTVLHDVATKLNWDDNSRCDRIILGYQDYDIERMSPLERVDWMECVQLRITSEIVEHKFKIGIPKDIFYNWIRKYTTAIDVVSASVVYINWYIRDGTTLSSLKLDLQKNGHNPTNVLNAVKLLTDMYNDIVSWKNFKRSLETMWNTPEDMRGTRVYDNIKSLHSHLTKTEWVASIVESKRALHKFYSQHVNMKNNFDITHVNVFSEQVRGMLQIQEEIHKSTFGENLYGAFTDLSCPKDSLVCLQCAVVDNFLYNSLLQVKEASVYYKDDYANVIVPTFETYWQNTSEYNARYTKAYRRAVKDKLDELGQRYGGGTLKVTLPFGEYLSGFFNGTYDTQVLINGVSYFLSGNYTKSIPPDADIIFPNDLQYYINLPFDQSCDTADWKWKSYKNNVGDGIWAVVLTFVSLEVFRLFVGDFNIVITAAMYTGAIVLAQFLYLFVVYGYNPTCTPVMPSYFIYDILMWVDENVFLECACSYVPYLSTEVCAQQTCDTCAITTTFKNCREYVPEFEELGLLYHFVFFFRWYFPDQFLYVGKLSSWPFPYIFSNTAMRTLVSDVERNQQVSGIEENCFYVNMMMPVSVLLLLYLAFMVSIPLLRIAVTWMKETFMIFINTILILYYLNRATGAIYD